MKAKETKCQFGNVTLTAVIINSITTVYKQKSVVFIMYVLYQVEIL